MSSAALKTRDLAPAPSEAVQHPIIAASPDLLSMVENLNYGRRRKRSVYWLAKRLFDIGAAGSALVLLSPVFFLIAAAIRLESKGPAFFIQARVGESLRVFRIFKFRTMYTGVNDDPVPIIDAVTQRPRRPRYFEDPRVTRVGRVLRCWSLDELPQLLNILRGDMSLVGPRPLTINESLLLPPRAWVRYSVPAGLTGLAQVTDRSIVLEPSRFDWDVAYIENLSFKQDLKIILRTVTALKQE